MLLLALVQEISNSFFHGLYRMYGQRLLNYAVKVKGLDLYLAEDLVQETFFKVFLHVKKLDQDDPTVSWRFLLKAFDWRLGDYYRKKDGCLDCVSIEDESSAVQIADPAEDVLDAYRARELFSDIYNIARGWKEIDVTILKLSSYGLSHQEIAAHLSSKSKAYSANSISIRIARLRKKLRCELAAESGWENV